MRSLPSSRCIRCLISLLCLPDICTSEVRSQEVKFMTDLLPSMGGGGGEMEGFMHAASLRAWVDGGVGEEAMADWLRQKAQS